MLLVLDDVHWADQSTLLLLRHLVAHAEPSAVLVFATYRDSELGRAHPLADVLADLRRERGVDRLPIRGLDQKSVAELVAPLGEQTLEDPGEALAVGAAP